jgi:hypothetical protein
MALSLKGEVVEFTAEKLNTVGDKTYASKQIVIEYGDDFPRFTAFEYDPDKKDFHKQCHLGDVVEVFFTVSSSKAKSGKAEGTYFSRVAPYRLNILQAKNPAPVQAQIPMNDAGISVQEAAQNTPAAAQEAKTSAVNTPSKAFNSPSQEEDDLPF